ncbi:LLM class flavin-dependent oxidoreductase [Streptosporangium nondiastaticum]|nr:LLM class flavin-dependent oxidoreductase [Streptosporangium nondiastaticum]
MNVPNFGDFADARNVAALAKAAETAGWDGLFLWDHVVHDKRSSRPVGDPWMLLTAAALATTSIKLGALVTPVPRRRPHQLARQVTTLDRISDGRVVFAAGLGGPVEDEYGSFGEPTDAVLLAERLDEGLGLLERYWTGERVTHRGRHFQARDVALLPRPVQRPRPPVWIAGYWPNRRPMRRAARWDGVVPLFASAGHGRTPPVEELRELVAYVGRHRPVRRPRGAPFEVVVGGVSPANDAAAARDLIGPLRDAGATWWDERLPLDHPGLSRLDTLLHRAGQGPPRLCF